MIMYAMYMYTYKRIANVHNIHHVHIMVMNHTCTCIIHMSKHVQTYTCPCPYMYMYTCSNLKQLCVQVPGDGLNEVDGSLGRVVGGPHFPQVDKDGQDS